VANIFQEIAGFLVKGAQEIASGAAWIGRISTDTKTILTEGGTLAPKTVADVVLVIEDVESLATLAAGAVSSEGVNFVVDSATYAAFNKLVNDLKTLGTTLKSDVQQLEKLEAQRAQAVKTETK
jgi:hypothetical protein